MKSTNKLKNKFIVNCSTQDYLKPVVGLPAQEVDQFLDLLNLVYY